MSTHVFNSWRVFIGDVDISQLVRSVRIDTHFDRLTTATLELLVLDTPTLIDGVIRFNMPPQATQPQPSPVPQRVLRLREDE